MFQVLNRNQYHGVHNRLFVCRSPHDAFVVAGKLLAAVYAVDNGTASEDGGRHRGVQGELMSVLYPRVCIWRYRTAQSLCFDGTLNMPVRGCTARDDVVKDIYIYTSYILFGRCGHVFPLLVVESCWVFRNPRGSGPNSHFWCFVSFTSVNSVRTSSSVDQIPMAVTIQPMALVGPEEIPVALVDFGEMAQPQVSHRGVFVSYCC